MAWHTDRQYCGKCHLTYVFQKVSTWKHNWVWSAHSSFSSISIGTRSLNVTS
jgi:hypothetical protein